MPDLTGQDEMTRRLLSQAHTIAVVGHSDNPERISYQIAQFLKTVGYTVLPVNPTVEAIDGQICYATLGDIPIPVDIVTVFRRSEYLAGVVEEAIAIGVPTVWAQVGVFDRQALQQALDAGLNIRMNACIKVEYLRLGIQHD